MIEGAEILNRSVVAKVRDAAAADKCSYLLQLGSLPRAADGIPRLHLLTSPQALLVTVLALCTLVCIQATPSPRASQMELREMAVAFS
ncbi:unnamed protein product [Lasius platythorax]|uniref:Uncharacterized protein n=1 Tax=Lasius platythorax TaxID=488582 RepID=A0AAV2NT41_9HYME